MPGQASLRANRYYAHPRNAFWPIIRFLIDGSQPVHEAMDQNAYEMRRTQAITHGIAVWDVLAHCERPGSLDSAIVKGTEVANDLEALSARHPELELVICNGKTAARLLERHVLTRSTTLDTLRRVTVPSSSPAMARLSLRDKAHAWKEAIERP